jgi:exopolysaccharide biosynthesis polyprenyl glycosylphosphotransferase
VAGGPSDALRAFLADARAAAFGPYVVGRLVPDGEPLASAGPQEPPCLGHLSDLPPLLHREAVDHVLFFPPLHRPSAAAAALDACELLGVPASFAVDLPHRSAAVPRVMARAGLPFVTFDVAPKSAAALAVKHGADVLAAAVALLLLAPVLLVIAAAVWATMGRPVLFVQERAGLYGRRFRMLKFRTMVRDAERQQGALRARNEMSGPVFKLTGDPRITRLGSALRRSSLDELPQLLNVLVGHMSLVGPRPLPLAEQKAIVGWQRRRLSMKPGLTGLWQVSGRSGVDFDEWMRLDMEYVDRWSLRSDLVILLRTLPAVLLGRGAR